MRRASAEHARGSHESELRSSWVSLSVAPPDCLAVAARECFPLPLYRGPGNAITRFVR